MENCDKVEEIKNKIALTRFQVSSKFKFNGKMVNNTKLRDNFR